MKQLETFMVSLANTLGQMTLNRTSPANDSGYYQNQRINTNNNQWDFLTGLNLNNAVFSVIIIGAIVLLLTGGSVKKKKSVIQK